MKQNNSVLSFEELQKKLQVCLDHGFETSITQRRKALKKQREKIISSEECFSTTTKQLARQFSL